MLKRFVFVAIASSLIMPVPSINASEKPEVISFTASKSDLDIFDANLKVTFELTVSHQAGIAESSTTLNIGVDGKHSLLATLFRSDNPIDLKLQKVVFRGEVEFPRTFPAGIYPYSVTGVSSNLSDGRKISTGLITAPNMRALKGATSGIILRNNGYLDLTEDILNGPSYSTSNSEVYENPSKFLSAPAPILRVGETLDLKTYYEVTVDEVALSAISLTPRICEALNNKILFTAIGTCTYSVSTSRSKNYASQTIKDTLIIDSARESQELFIPKVPNQLASNIPINIQLDPVYSSGISAVQYVFPESQTNNVCEVAGYILRIVSGGICKLTYKSNGNDKFLPSKTYIQEITIERKPQNISFTLPEKINLKEKSFSLSAKSDSGASILFLSESPDVCSINTDLVNFKKVGICKIKAVQSGNAQYEPAYNDKSFTIFTEEKKVKCRQKSANSSKKKKCNK